MRIASHQADGSRPLRLALLALAAAVFAFLSGPDLALHHQLEHASHHADADGHHEPADQTPPSHADDCPVCAAIAHAAADLPTPAVSVATDRDPTPERVSVASTSWSPVCFSPRIPRAPPALA